MTASTPSRSTIRLLVLGTLIGLGLGLAAFLITDPAQAQTAPPEVVIEVRNFTYDPLNVDIVEGTTVRWINRDSVGHTATERASPRTFDVSLSPGVSGTVTFVTPGRYRYFCSPHEFNMPIGVINVFADPNIWRGSLYIPSLSK
jgi:plastocyanin